MAGVLDRLDERGGEPTLRRLGLPLGEVLGPLREGEPAAKVAARHGLDAGDLVAALAFEALGGDESEGPPLVQETPRHPALGRVLGEPTWAELLSDTPRPSRLALAAGLLQVHDFWDASHEAAQQADDLGERSVSAYWHGIAHRREPDAGNASYWFRRVGRHPLYVPLGASARALLADVGDPTLADRIAPRGVWDPFAFIAFCAEGRPRGGMAALARTLQRREMVLLLDATLEAAGVS